MKRTLIFFMGILPLLVTAQQKLHFPENVTLIKGKTELNTSASDFAPSFVETELWFSAFSPEEIKKINKGETKNIYYKLFSVSIDNAGNITGSKKAGQNQFSSDYHIGPASYCKATGELFVTLSNYENPDVKNIVFQKANIPLKVVIFKKYGTRWQISSELPYNSSLYSVGHPAVSITGDSIIFSSNIPGKGFGGTDLYMGIRQNGKWGEMINLGEKINTTKDEMFPSFHKGKILFYASDGKETGKGGLDIYYSRIIDNNFEESKSMDSLNGSEDDFGLIIHPSEETGYYVSRKNGGLGDDDIYKVTFDGEYNLELLVRNKKTMSPITNVKVKFNDNTVEYTDNNGLIKRKLLKKTDYQATSTLEGFLNESISFSTKNRPYGTIKATINIEEVKKGQKFVMDNIYYDFDRTEILPESAIELDKLIKILKDNPSWKVELGSHTDSRGSSTYNMKLSKKRSKSTLNYIISKGITADRIIVKSYGETQLINKCSDGVWCTIEQHRENRRTEFTILEITQ